MISLSMISDLRVLLAQGGARGQNLEHLHSFFYCISSSMEAVVDEFTYSNNFMMTFFFFYV